MRQSGCHLIHSKAENVACVRDDDGIMFTLPGHPNPVHVTRDFASPPVLTEAAAAVVLEGMHLPAGANRGEIYVQQAFVAGAELPFTTAIWFTPECADGVTGAHAGAGATHQRELLQEWRRGEGEAVGGQQASASGGGSMPASGQYTELGLGVLPGRGRKSVVVAGEAACTPFARAPGRSSLMEPYLARVMSSASAVAAQALDGQWLGRQWSVRESCQTDAARAFQYPAAEPARPMLSSHQVAIRGPRLEGPGRRRSAAERAREVLHSLSDLHVDTMDGGGDVGAGTLYSCMRVEGGGWGRVGSVHDGETALRRRDVADFPQPGGGRGVRIHVMVPDWNCLVLKRTSACLHGSVFPDGMHVQPRHLLLPGLQLMRVVTYPLKQVEKLMSLLAREPQDEMWWSSFDPWVRMRAADDSRGATDAELRERFGERAFADGIARYVLTDVPQGVCRRAATLVWRRCPRGVLERHCVVADSELLRRVGYGGKGLYSWRQEVDPNLVWGRYAGKESVHRSAADAEAACLQNRVYCMPVVRTRQSGRLEHVVVDPSRLPDAFLRYANDPKGLGVLENAQFELDGQLRADGALCQCYALDATPAENAEAEIIALYRKDGAYVHKKDPHM